MKKAVSPALLVVVVVAFFLPFVSVSCDASAFEAGLGELGEGLEGLGGETEPNLNLPTQPIEVSATGIQIVLDDAPEPEGLEGLGEGLGADFAGGFEQPASEGSLAGRVFAILALVAAVGGIGLGFLRDPAGGAAAIVTGAAAALFLFLMKSDIDGELGAATLVGFQVRYEYGFWIALIASIAAAGVGIWRVAAGRTVVVPPPAGEQPPPPAGEQPPPPPSVPPPTD